MPNLQDVKQFWNDHPLMTFEIPSSPLTKNFFEQQDAIKRNEVERFGYGFWEFDKHPKEKVLDIGCGVGWLVRQFATFGTDITGVDISAKSLEIAQAGNALFGLNAILVEGSAESLPFSDNSFDYCTSSGVLHHTPDTAKAFQEVYRVLKPGGYASISLYYKNILLHPRVFPVTRRVFALFAPKVPGRAGLNRAKTPEEFVRIYDGDSNPVGTSYSLAEAKEIARPFKFLSHEIHYFPARFLVEQPIPEVVHRFLDRRFGTMIYLKLQKA